MDEACAALDEYRSPWARRHLSLLTDSEIAALYGYLHTMPVDSRR